MPPEKPKCRAKDDIARSLAGAGPTGRDHNYNDGDVRERLDPADAASQLDRAFKPKQ